MILTHGCHSKRTSLLDSQIGDQMNLRNKVLKTMSSSGLAVKATVMIRADSGKTSLIINIIRMVSSVFVTKPKTLNCIKAIKCARANVQLFKYYISTEIGFTFKLGCLLTKMI